MWNRPVLLLALPLAYAVRGGAAENTGKHAYLSAGDSIAKCSRVIPSRTLRPDDLGPLKVTCDLSGMCKMSLVPAPGVHPRVLLSPEDREPLHRIYRRTPYRKRVWRILLGWCHILKDVSFSTWPKSNAETS